jgi:hypothetical protein
MAKLLHFFRRKVHGDFLFIDGIVQIVLTNAVTDTSSNSAVAKAEFQRDSQLPTNTNRRPFPAPIDSHSGPSKKAEATNALTSSLEVFSHISMPTLQIAAILLLESVDHVQVMMDVDSRTKETWNPFVQEILQDEGDLPTFAERMKTLSSMVAEIDHQRRLNDYQRILDRLPTWA